ALEADGLKRQMITRREFPGLPEDVPTLDFSGWPIFCLESASDDMIYKFCEALEARKDRIPWYGKGPMALETMCKDSVEARSTCRFIAAPSASGARRGICPKRQLLLG